MKGDQPPVPIPLASAKQDLDETPVADEQKTRYQVQDTHPRYLSVPSLNIENSRIQAIDAKQSGELDTPSNIHDTGWYKKSAQPGDLTSALLLDGHNQGPSKDGVFKQLPKLKVGSDIEIERGDGEVFVYEVKEVRVVTLDSLRGAGMKQLSSSVDSVKQGLNIMSPTGKWVPAKQSYDKRVVVRAALKG